MAEIRTLLKRIAVISIVFMTVQGCATTDELFAEYDEKFCGVQSLTSAASGSAAIDVASPIAKPVADRESSIVNTAAEDGMIEVPAASDKLINSKSIDEVIVEGLTQTKSQIADSQVSKKQGDDPGTQKLRVVDFGTIGLNGLDTEFCADLPNVGGDKLP